MDDTWTTLLWNKYLKQRGRKSSKDVIRLAKVTSGTMVRESIRNSSVSFGKEQSGSGGRRTQFAVSAATNRLFYFCPILPPLFRAFSLITERNVRKNFLREDSIELKYSIKYRSKGYQEYFFFKFFIYLDFLIFLSSIFVSLNLNVDRKDFQLIYMVKWLIFIINAATNV